MKVVRIRDGEYRVEHDDRQDVIYVARSTGSRWVFWNGHVFHEDVAVPPTTTSSPRLPSALASQSLMAPMPATVIKVLVSPGATVRKGDTVVVLEAMKMELPLRAPADATVTAVNCREGDLVQPDQVLVDLR